MKFQVPKQKSAEKNFPAKVNHKVLAVRFYNTEEEMPKHDIWSNVGLHIF